MPAPAYDRAARPRRTTRRRCQRSRQNKECLALQWSGAIAYRVDKFDAPLREANRARRAGRSVKPVSVRRIVDQHDSFSHAAGFDFRDQLIDELRDERLSVWRIEPKAPLQSWASPSSAAVKYRAAWTVHCALSFEAGSRSISPMTMRARLMNSAGVCHSLLPVAWVMCGRSSRLAPHLLRNQSCSPSSSGRVARMGEPSQPALEPAVAGHWGRQRLRRGAQTQIRHGGGFDARLE